MQFMRCIVRCELLRCVALVALHLSVPLLRAMATQGKVRQRARFLMKVAPGANFRTVIQRHPRVSADYAASTENLAALCTR